MDLSFNEQLRGSLCKVPESCPNECGGRMSEDDVVGNWVKGLSCFLRLYSGSLQQATGTSK